MKGKKKDFVKKAYNGKEFKLEITCKEDKELFKGIVRCVDKSKLFDYMATIDYFDECGNFYGTTYVFFDTEDQLPEVGSVYYTITFYKEKKVERNAKATRKYKKLRDKAYAISKRLNRRDEISEIQKYKSKLNTLLEE